jgi:hypothetical protein
MHRAGSVWVAEGQALVVVPSRNLTSRELLTIKLQKLNFNLMVNSRIDNADTVLASTTKRDSGSAFPVSQ